MIRRESGDFEMLHCFPCSLMLLGLQSCIPIFEDFLFSRCLEHLNKASEKSWLYKQTAQCSITSNNDGFNFHGS